MDRTLGADFLLPVEQGPHRGGTSLFVSLHNGLDVCNGEEGRRIN